MDDPSNGSRTFPSEAPPVVPSSNDEETVFEGLPVLSDDFELLQRGICRVKLPEDLDAARWADELSQPTPMILGFEGDGEYAFYRNILDEPEFPFETILFRNSEGDGSSELEKVSGWDGLSEIGRSILRHFPVLPSGGETIDNDNPRRILSRELRLDDAFCVHYNMDQEDTSGAKHVDPSDITINMCLHKSEDTRGSYVLFHGTKRLEVPVDGNNDDSDSLREAANQTGLDSGSTSSSSPSKTPDKRFLVPQRAGYATIHFGDHPHETTPLRRGSRTNIILTYMYTDETRSDATTRSCY